jgi:proteasome accessory factor C
VSGALDQLPRLLALVPWLLAHPDSRIADVAARFGVSEQQITADLKLIWMCGLPGHGPGDLIDVVWDGDRVSLSNADTIARPLRLTLDEALALVAALRALLGTPGLVDTTAADAALAKLEAAAGAAVGADVGVAADTSVDAAAVATVTEALALGRRVHLRYWVPARDEATERDVDPIRMFTGDGGTYLVGWCRAVEDVRTFRLDRVLAATLLDVPADVPAEARERALTAAVFTPSADDPLVTLELDPGARWVADYHPCEQVTERGDGGLVVRLRARDEAWLVRLGLGLAGTGRVVDPPELAAAVQEAARAARANYPRTVDAG